MEQKQLVIEIIERSSPWNTLKWQSYQSKFILYFYITGVHQNIDVCVLLILEIYATVCDGQIGPSIEVG